MNANDDRRDDAALRALFSSLDKDSPAPDPDFRKRLHEQSLEVFRTHSSEPSDHTQASHPGRRGRMFSYLWRSAAAAAVAAGLLLAVWFLALPPATAGEPTLGEALDKLASAKSIHLRIAQPGRTAEAWFSQPGLLRRNHPDGTYLIARGNRAWLVDEKANRASSRPAGFFRGDGAKLDVAALLEVGEPADWAAALAARPAERVERDGSACWVYRAQLETRHGRIRLQATVDAATQLLRSLETTIDRDGRVEPLAALTVLGVNEPVREELFVVGAGLSEDGRIGKVADAQGIVSVKPVMVSRWTPVGSGSLVMPGDWLRTDKRGANAAALRLVNGAELVVGPGSMVELIKAGQLRLIDGEARLLAAAGSPVELLGPDGQKAEVGDRAVFRVDKEKLVRLAADPLWLKGFEGAVVNESIGSLVAKVEGRNVPLTVGYHKVTVDIRDQIARTVVEESFVNHTDGRLEGVFHFPLPQDASISGFGMWIGNELIEADVVEKQRAREIYEQILRERRDPGLLEWSGGNLFKARVFPIEPHSEKRIRITYTQVLPLRGGACRYSYALQSEMLKQHPLRELQIDVKLNSAMPLKAVTCPTHAARTDQTAHSAHVEFAAQEYTPARDFEVVIEVDGRQNDVVLVPHRRGEDGYFMLLLTPPAPDGDWQRDILPDAAGAAELLVLADTSASMDASQRSTQGEFVAALLTSLGPKDTFNLAACDVDCDWVFDKSMAADAPNVAAAREFLARRVPLGWTDLDKAFASAIKRCGPKTHVVYVGDGIPTTADADPVAFANRLRRLGEGKPGTFYAVSVGSTFESGVLKAIASLGGGSMRQISGENRPSLVARELLEEMARPPLRDLKVFFRGLRTARVYPEELANLPAGAQQIILGRYLPEGADQAGEVVVTGTRAGQPVRFSSRVSLKDAESGNSFIPRLWARMHLDYLLGQGAAGSQAIRDEIIALSEEYHIMTPYTSLLVLESDADRERFKVKRRFLMRDGEKFFAEGRDTANYELVQQQMKRAGNWRLGLRRAVLRQLANLGRGGQVAPQPWLTGALPRSRSGGGEAPVHERYWSEDINGDSSVFWGDESGRGKLSPSLDRLDDLTEKAQDEAGAWRVRGTPSEELGEWMPEEDLPGQPSYPVAGPVGADSPPDPAFLVLPYSVDYYEHGDLKGGLERQRQDGRRFYRFAPDEKRWKSHVVRRHRPSYAYNSRGGGYGYTGWLNTLFPLVPAAAKVPPPLKDGWPAEARAVAESLLRRDVLARLKGGLSVERQTETFDVQTGELTRRSTKVSLVSTGAWLVRSEYDNSQTLVQWCDGRRRTIFNRGFLLGRTRAAVADDLANQSFGFGAFAFQSLERSYSTWRVELKPQADRQILLLLTHPSSPGSEMRVLVDTARHVVLGIENHRDGKVTFSQKFGDFVQAAGAWWPGKAETFDDQNRRTGRVTEKFVELAPDKFDEQVRKELTDRDRVQFLSEPGRALADAKQAAALAKADFDDQITLLLHFARSQQWERVFEHLAAAEKLAAGKPGIRWVRGAVLAAARRHEELKKRILAEAAALANMQPPTREDLPLADYLLGQAGGVLAANEMLGLGDTLQPVHARQPAHLHALKRWRSQRVSLLQQTGRNDEALGLLKQLAGEYPRDCSLQLRYAQGLVNAGRSEDAFAWLRQALDRTHWQPHEEENLRSNYADMLNNQGRYEDMVAFAGQWVQRNPAGTGAYRRYLSALIRVDRVGEADKLIAQWLKEGRSPERLAPPVAGRLEAAVSQALGQGYYTHTDRLDEQWLEPLAETALFFARHPSHAHPAERIMNYWRFQQTDQCRRVRKAAVEILLAEIDKLTPYEVRRLVEWIMPNDPAIEKDAWKRLAAGLHKRWTAAQTPEEKHVLGQTLGRVYSARLDVADYLGFLRQQLKEGPAGYRAGYARQLFDALTSQPWLNEYEDEAIALLEQLSDVAEGPQRLASAVNALHRLTDRMVRGRYQAKMKAVEHPEELPRTELRARQVESLRLARREFADRLRREMSKRSGPIVKWLDAERLYLDVLTGRDLAKAADECWEILGPQPEKVDLAEHPERWLDEVLRNRMLVTLVNLACRRGADPALIARLIRFADQGISLDTQDPRWRLFKFELLVGLDRPADLEQALHGWIRGDDPDNRWKIALGYLLAEQGKLAEAIRLFEAVAAADELGPGEYRTLADWYMVVDRREQHRRAMIASYKTMEEWRLGNFLSQRLRPWRDSDGKPPAELDEQVLLVFAALFEKSGSPQSYLWQLREFYTNTRDFRLLAGLADAVVGHTAGKVYPFLAGMGSVLAEVHDEATADSIVEHLAEVRERAKTEIDQRALDLLEALAERRAAELLNQPGPHGQKAVAALKRAFRRAWSPGEPRLMADLLAGLGAISYKPLGDEQVSQLETLHRQADKGSGDRLHVAFCLARTYWGYARHASSIDLLADALGEFEQANKGVLPQSANDALATLVGYLEQRRHFARGEKALLEQLKHPAHHEQRLWLTLRLYELYQNAVRDGGSVSLGSGATLYKAAEAKVLADLDTPDHGHRYNLVSRLCSLYRTAHDRKLPGVADDLRAFAFKTIPEVLKRQTSNYDSMVGAVAHTLRDVAGPRDGLAFLIQRIEQEPAWFRWNNQDGWSRHSGELARWRTEVKELGDLEPRLLKIVLGELRRDLESRSSRSRAAYHRHSGYYWEAKEQDFRKVAEEVYAERKGSGAAVAYIADYLFWGLDHHDRAIEILFIAHKDKLLDEAGQWRLVDFLHRVGRYGESVALLQALVEWRPDNLDYRLALMRAFFHTKRQAELLELLARTDEHFHTGGRWNEGVLANLASTCLQTQLYEQSVAYYRELIPLHQRTRPNRGIGNGTLSGYYTGMARAYAGLGKPAEAVDAACGAIVSWGPTHRNRADAIRALQDVIRQAPRLDHLVAELDREAAETGLHNPIVRKAVGQVCLEKKDYAKAIAQLRLACEVQPNDVETHQALVACYDQQNDKDGAIRQILQSLQLARRNIELYRDLGRRFAESNQPRQAERARTSIVEVLPGESESHAMLAEVRQQQDRWPEAVVHWEQVARIRALEPTGLLKLAEAQLRLKQYDQAAQTVRKLRAKGWPARFGDVDGQARALERRIEQERGRNKP